jgi:hypothetical protein
LGSQTTVALENSRLFEEVRFTKNGNDSFLRTMETGVEPSTPKAGQRTATGRG